MRTYLVLIVGAAVVAVAAASAYGFLWSAREARIRAMSAMALQAERGATAVADALAGGRRTVADLSARSDRRAVLARPEDCSLTATAGRRIDIVDPRGGVACSSDPAVATGDVHAGSDWLATALRSPGLVVDPDATDGATGRRAVVITMPIDRAEPGAGTVALFVDVAAAASLLSRNYASSDDVGFTLVDRVSGEVISASEGSVGGAFPARTSGDWEGADGARRLFGSAPVAGVGWRVFAGVRRSAVLADARGALMRNLLVGVLSLLVVIAAAWTLERRVAGPLRRIIDAVSRAGGGLDGTRAREDGAAELVALAREFNSMLDVRAGHEAQLLHQATHDPLTGLPNKALLGGQLAEALAGEADVAVFCVGLERLDIVTDGLGHDAGDHVVVEVARRLSKALDPQATLARFAGAEFVVICPGIGDERAGPIAGRLLGCLERPFRGPDAGIVMTGSVGVAVGRAGTSPEQLLREADSAMREARMSGHGWMLFDRAMQLRATRHLAIEHDLWQALRHGELTVRYQPLIDIGSGRVVAAEALVRWEHPQRGLVPPLDFIPTAEETGQISAIGRFVLAEACDQAAAWAVAGHPLRMSVNVAVGQLRDPAFPGLVSAVLSETGLTPDRLCLEITESSLLREADHSAAELVRLKQLGIDLAMDDFGTGYSSLAYLRHLPVDELKIDRSFISRLGRAGRDRHLVEAIVGMAQALDLAVVAEGVESDEQLEFLRGLGCKLAQGYLFSPAVPADELLALASASRSPSPRRLPLG